MPATLSKADVLKAIQEIPDEKVSIDDVVRRLILLNDIQTGLEQMEAGEGLLTQDQVEAQFEARRSARSA